MSISKQQYANEVQKIARLTDKLGLIIDPGIFDIVVLLRILGINTVSSCEGHLNRITEGPYIMFEALEINDYKNSIVNEPHDLKNREYKIQYEKAVSNNTQELNKMLILLDGFYNDRPVAINQRLIVRCIGSSTAQLICQGASLAYILNKNERKVLLEKNKLEMRAFANYLKLA